MVILLEQIASLQLRMNEIAQTSNVETGTTGTCWRRRVVTEIDLDMNQNSATQTETVDCSESAAQLDEQETSRSGFSNSNTSADDDDNHSDRSRHSRMTTTISTYSASYGNSDDRISNNQLDTDTAVEASACDDRIKGQFKAILGYANLKTT